MTAAVDVAHVAAPQLEIAPHAVTGFASGTLIAASKIAGTVVVGSHGRGAMPTALVGSVSQQVAIQSSCPVVVVRANRTPPGATSGHVVVGLDGSAASEPALGYAFAFAASTPSTLTPVHA
jgi:nucleotide-binding universal stress UspA family protein